MPHQSILARLLFVGLILPATVPLSPLFAAADNTEKVGRRPYEMQWAGRTQDTHPPLVDFEDLTGWTVKTHDAKATLTRCREQQLWGKHVAKLVYRRDGKQPRLTLNPPKPIEIKLSFDCVNFWVYGNNWAWVSERDTPQVPIRLLLRNRKGQVIGLDMGRVRWKEWWVMHHKLTPAQLELFGDGAVFAGIEISGGRNKQDRVLYFDNISFYKERLEPLEFEPRPARGIALPKGQTTGTNTGPGRLPFPTREKTILPDNLSDNYKNTLERDGDGYLFHYRGDDGHLLYRYRPAAGDLGDVEVQWSGPSANPTNTKKFRPMAGGGIFFHQDGAKPAHVKPQKISLLSCRQEGDSVVSKWKCTHGDQSAELTYTLRLLQKSLLVDVKCLPTSNNSSPVGEFRIGRAVDVENPRLVTIPYLTGHFDRPAVLVTGAANDPLFTFALVDHTRSNASLLWAENKILITDHETGWRDGGESFTFRTKAAPGKGGDAGQLDYTKKIHALGHRYGIYNNYTDYAPVNEHWDEDCVTRTPGGNWRPAWARCYNPKPARAVEFEARLAPIIQKKFGLNTAYCDVHTAVTPWTYVDFDARVPGAGTFAATFYAYGEIMLHQKKTWNGPVYSEGNNHWYYCGLTDGNYAQDQRARLPANPWLVDFDLRKIHPLCCNFGMGYPSMFYSRAELKRFRGKEKWEPALDRFMAATLAFGHTGFLVRMGGMPCTLRSYYCLQQVHARYAQQKVADIRYADAQGKLLSTSVAVANGAFQRSQVAVTYDDGLRVIVNGHPSESWTLADTTLPPNGWLVQDPKQHSLVAWSKTIDGHRADYVDSPAYIYADGRGQFTRFEKAATDGQLIAKRLTDKRHGPGAVELIPVGVGQWFAVAIDTVAIDGITSDVRPITAMALDKAGKELGPAKTRFSRGLVFVLPVKDAFSYILKPAKADKGIASGLVLSCDRIEVVPGERVTISSEPTGVVATGKSSHEFEVPPDAQPGTLLWHEHENACIDFSVVPFVDASLQLQNGSKSPNGLQLTLTSHAASPLEAKVTLAGRTKTVRLVPQKPSELFFEHKRPKQEAVAELPMTVTAGDLSFRKTWWHKTEYATVDVARLPEKPATG